MISFDANTRMFHLTNQHVSYLMAVTAGELLTHIYFGAPLPFVGGSRQYPRVDRSFSPNLAASQARDYSPDTQPQEYPADHGDFRIAAASARQSNGAQVLDLHYVSHTISAGKPKLTGMPATFGTEAETETLTLHLQDPQQLLDVDLHYTLFTDLPVITRWVTFHNRSEATLALTRAMSMSMDFPVDDWQTVDLAGGWSKETHVHRRPVDTGLLTLDSKRGISSHQHNPFVALVHPDTTEQAGEAYGFNLIYSGNHAMQVEQDQLGSVRVQAGINDYHFNWPLGPDDIFATPEAVMVYSNQGLNGMSQAFHALYLDHLMPPHQAHQRRPIVANNWEATFFDFTFDRLRPIIDQAAEDGIELFVLDDGWFGHRADDTSSLGDWFEYKGKIAGGLAQLSAYVHAKGMKFGLWFEPEMVSADSKLYLRHPDWAYAIPGTPPMVGRDQYVLDITRQEVRTFIIGAIEKILDHVPIDYIKWDMNRSLTDVYSRTLPAEAQGEVYHRYVLGLYQMVQQLTGEHPEILFESCAGGGGRFDPGMLAYMPQSWTSDNTDAIARLEIQAGASLVYPPVAMGSHVAAVPNSQNGRMTPLDTRGAVAMAANLGYELDLTTLSTAQQARVKEQVAFYKQHRALIQFGRFYRIQSPDTHHALVSWGMVDAHADHAIFFVYSLGAQANPDLFVQKFVGLAPNKRYRVSGFQGEYSGAELMAAGFYLDPEIYRGDYNSRIYTVDRVEESS